MALEARALTVAHPGAPSEAGPAAGPLDLTLAPGEWLGVVGGNGSGKTALLLTLAGLVPRAGGDLTLDGRDPAASPRGGRTDVGIVFQEPETQFVSDRVARELAFPLENLGWPRAAIDARVDELLDAFDLRALALAPPDRLSGGEMQRVALAAAVAARPRYLLLDEPASYLDAAARAELERWTRAYVAREGAAVAWTECDARACAAADRVLHLPSPAAAAPVGELAGDAPAPTGLAGPTRWRGRGLALTVPGEGRAGGRRLWGGLDLEIRGGETWALVAPNGWGKTALLETLAGWREPGEGTLVRPPLSDLGYLAQFPEYQLFAATAGDDVGFAARYRPAPGGKAGAAETERRVARALAWVGLDPARDRDRSPEALSLGERRRLAIAGVMIAEPLALLLDEPTAGLDPPATERVLRALGQAAARGAAVVLATHDPEIALRLHARRLDLPEPTPITPVAGSDSAVDTDRNI